MQNTTQGLVEALDVCDSLPSRIYEIWEILVLRQVVLGEEPASTCDVGCARGPAVLVNDALNPRPGSDTIAAVLAASGESLCCHIRDRHH